MHCVLWTAPFERAAADAGLTDDERHQIETILSDEPTLGEMIPGTGGARKWRLAKEGKGKRSGYRVITYYAAEDVPVFLLDIYAKGERVNLSQAERNMLKSILAGIADDYRATAREKVRKLSEMAS